MSAEAEIVEQVSENTEVQTEQKPSGYHPVDLSDLPEDKAKAIADRIDYLYGQVKYNERNMREFKSVAAQQSALLDELRSNVGHVVTHLNTEKLAETESALETRMQEAFEAGDNKAYMKAQKDLIELKTKQLVGAQKPQQQTQAQINNARQLAQQAQADGEISPQDAQLLSVWAEERDDRGQMLRPWSVNSSSDPNLPDPDFVKAALLGQQYYAQNPGATMEKVLEHIDSKMGVRKNAGQAVMGGNLTRPGKAATVSLTPKQQEIAVRTKYAGPGKSDSEHLAAYKKQIESMKGSKR